MDEASRLVRYSGKATLTEREVQMAVRLVLTGELARVASLWFEQTPYFPVEYLGWNAGMRRPPPPPLRDAPPSPPFREVNNTVMEEAIQDEEETVPWTAVAVALMLGLALSGCIVLMIFRRRRGLGWGI